MLGFLGGLSWISIAKWAGIVVLAGVAAWYIDDYGYQKRQRAIAEAAVREAVIANQSLVEARQRADRRHQAEMRARDRIDALEREHQADLVDLAKRLAALPSDQDCVGGPALQDLIDSLRGEAP